MKSYFRVMLFQLLLVIFVISFSGSCLGADLVTTEKSCVGYSDWLKSYSSIKNESLLTFVPKANVDDMIYFSYEGVGEIKYNLHITPSGSGITSFKKVTLEQHKYYTDDINYYFQLNKQEIEALKSLIYNVHFFEQPEKDTQFATDTGRSVLYISIDGKSRELHFEYRPEIYPLTSFFYKIISQAEVLTSLEKRGYVYGTESALSPYCLWPRVLQPYVFKDPLIKVFRKISDREQLIYATRALSYLMTPNEWAEFFTGEIKKANESRKMLLLYAFTDQMMYVPDNSRCKPYQKAITPTLYKCLSADYLNLRKMSVRNKLVYMRLSQKGSLFFVVSHVHMSLFVL